MGVFIALAINEWNSDRLERAEEVLIVERLVSDLQSDLRGYERGFEFLPRKEESLRRLYSGLMSADSRPRDLTRFLQDVIHGSDYGWNQYRASRTTLDELLGSGKLGLIRSADARTAIGEYYEPTKGCTIGLMKGRPNTRASRTSWSLEQRRSNSIHLSMTSRTSTVGCPRIRIDFAGARDRRDQFRALVRERFVELHSKCTELIMALQAYLEAERQT